MSKCGQQLTTSDGSTEVRMKGSGEVVRLGVCTMPVRHFGPCGRLVTNPVEVVDDE